MKIHGQFLHHSRGVLHKTWIKSSKLKPIILDFPKGYLFDLSSRKDPHTYTEGKIGVSLLIGARLL